ncbi:MAG: DNA-directed RNA polymerase subunit omega [Clostridium sp.]|uniref:DNA-directed RNA polymerase subunit omega n=1 Tax=Clostridium sp. TaxID=1506 RepID=UPI00304CC8A1
MNDSMINPSIIKLLETVDNRYSLVVATSRRARQLIEGAEPLIRVGEAKALTIAIQEVDERIITVQESVTNEDCLLNEEVEDIQEVEEGLN